MREHGTGGRRLRLPTALGLFVFATGIFVVAPLVAVIGSSFTSASYVSFPPVGLSLRWYEELLRRPDFLEAFRTSGIVAIVSASIATVLGTSAALAIARYNFPGRTILATLFLTPLMLPTIVIGIALLVFFSGLGLPRNMLGLVIGHVLISVPFVIRLVGTSLAGFDRNLERAAESLGASPWVVFRRVTLPLIKKGVLAGAAFAAVVSFDDVSVAVFLSSFSATTLPVKLYTSVEQSYNPLVPAVSTVTIAVIVVAVVIIERFLGVLNLYQVRTRR